MSDIYKYKKYKNKYLDLKMKGGGKILEEALKAINENSPKCSSKKLPIFSCKDVPYFIYKLENNPCLLDNITIPYCFTLTKKTENDGNTLYTLTITDVEKNITEINNILLDRFD